MGQIKRIWGKNMNVTDTIFDILGIIAVLFITLLMAFLLISWITNDLPFFKATKRRAEALDEKEKKLDKREKNVIGREKALAKKEAECNDLKAQCNKTIDTYNNETAKTIEERLDLKNKRTQLDQELEKFDEKVNTRATELLDEKYPEFKEDYANKIKELKKEIYEHREAKIAYCETGPVVRAEIKNYLSSADPLLLFEASEIQINKDQVAESIARGRLDNAFNTDLKISDIIFKFILILQKNCL